MSLFPKKWFFVLVCICFASITYAQSGTTIGNDENSGRAKVFQVLTIPPSARAAALGNTFVAMKDDPTTIFSNPAALSTQTKRDSIAPRVADRIWLYETCS